MKMPILLSILTIPTSSSLFRTAFKSQGWPRIKALGEVSLFGADVVSDIYNGMILIHGPASLNATDDGQTSKPHPVWGYSMLFIPFLPMLVMVGQLAFQDKIQGSEHGCCRLGWTVLSLLVALPITALATPLYILYILYTGVRKIISPTHDGKRAAQLKTYEICVESSLQTCLGEPLSHQLPRPEHPLGAGPQPGAHGRHRPAGRPRHQPPLTQQGGRGVASH